MIIVTTENENSKLWHQRLGHMSKKGINIMHSIGKLPSLNSMDLDMCDECILENLIMVSLQTYETTPIKEKLEFAHVRYLGNNNHLIYWWKNNLMTLIDYYYSLVWFTFGNTSSK